MANKKRGENEEKECAEESKSGFLPSECTCVSPR